VPRLVEGSEGWGRAVKPRRAAGRSAPSPKPQPRAGTPPAPGTQGRLKRADYCGTKLSCSAARLSAKNGMKKRLSRQQA